MITLVHVDDIIDEQTSNVVFGVKDNIVAYMLSNTGAVNFTWGDNVVLQPGDTKSVGGSTLIPFVQSKKCSFATGTGLKRVVIEKVISVVIDDPKPKN